jgi:hypothetical protein
MAFKADIGWTRRTEDGVKLDVYAYRTGGEWRFFQREKRYDQWQPVAEPPLEDWLELLDAINRMIPRRRYPPDEAVRVRKMILDRFPEADV